MFDRLNLTREEALRAANEMALYISIVLLATLSALPDDFDVTGPGGRDGPPLAAVLWGTTIGLTLAHWFAFHLASLHLNNGKLPRRDLERLGMQMAGAAGVTLVTMIPIALAKPAHRVEAAMFAPGLVIGIAGYLVARGADKSRVRSVMTGVGVLILGILVAALKSLLAGH